MKQTEIIVLGLIVVVVGALFVIRAGNTDSTVNNQGAGTGNTEDNSLPVVGATEYAPDFSTTSLAGNTVTLSSYRGAKPVILDFWASWCPNCQRDMPKLSRLYEQYKDQVEVVGVNLQETQSVVQRYIESKNIAFPIVFDPKSEISRAYGVQYTNTHVLINREGQVVRVIPGDIKESDIQALIQ